MAGRTSTEIYVVRIYAVLAIVCLFRRGVYSYMYQSKYEHEFGCLQLGPANSSDSLFVSGRRS